MTLYDIDARLVMLLNDHFDIEDGVICETEEELAKKIDEVSLDLNTKISNIACFVKNLLSDAEQLKTEKQNLEKRQKQAERKAEYLKNYLDGYLHSVINEKIYLSISFQIHVVRLDIESLSQLPLMILILYQRIILSQGLLKKLILIKRLSRSS